MNIVHEGVRILITTVVSGVSVLSLYGIGNSVVKRRNRKENKHYSDFKQRPSVKIIYGGHTGPYDWESMGE